MTNFNANETQRINNYINNQISTGKGLEDWNIPTYGMFGIYTGIGYWYEDSSENHGINRFNNNLFIILYTSNTFQLEFKSFFYSWSITEFNNQFISVWLFQ